MNFGNVSTNPCINTPPAPKPIDARCSDEAFAIANPTICGASTKALILKPGVSICCLLGSVQLTAVLIQGGIETDVTTQCVFTTSDNQIAVVGASSGNVTGLNGGDAIITAVYQNLTAACEFTVVGEAHCCDSIPVAMMVLVDDSKSMSQTFNSTYPTKLVYAKAAATQFISSVNSTKDVVGLMQFDDSVNSLLAAPGSNSLATAALVAGITQTQQLTGFNSALVNAIAQLDTVSAIEKVLVIISDGEDTSLDTTDRSTAISTINTFKSAGGIIICLGARATGDAFLFLEAISTGGFFINGYNATAADGLTYLMGLKGYLCAGNCTPLGDGYYSTGALNYCAFTNWAVTGGHVDLIGNGLLDFLPGNGLYVDLAGATAPHGGKLTSRSSYALISGENYRLSLKLAGNQRLPSSPNTVRMTVFMRNTDIIANPSAVPTLSIVQAGLPIPSPQPVLKYVYTYVNANGETAPSAAASITPTDFGFAVTVHTTASATATAIRIYRTTGSDPDSPYYMIAEIAPTAPAYVDHMDLQDMEAALVAGTVDACAIVPTSNTTGTPVYFLDQSVTMNDFQQGFTAQSFNFTMPYNATVWISFQQTSIPSEAGAAGLLLDSIAFDNTTTLTNILADDFSTENQTYVPPKCGLGTTYVPLSSVAEPQPLNALPNMTGNTSPAGFTASADAVTGGAAWNAFDGNDNTSWFGSYPVGFIKIAVPDPFVPIAYSIKVPVNPATFDMIADGEGDPYPGSSWLNWDYPFGTFTRVLRMISSDGVLWTNDSDTAAPAVPGPYRDLVSASGFYCYVLADDDLNVVAVSNSAMAPVPYTTAPAPVANSPLSWTFEGSNNNSDWDVLDTQTNSAFVDGIETKEFGFSNTTSYAYFRLNISNVPFHSGSKVAVSELKIFIEGITPTIPYGYVTGYNCYGDGCLSAPPPIQLQDPNPLPSIESAATTPKQYTSTKNVCVSCPAGSVNQSDAPFDQGVLTQSDDFGTVFPSWLQYQLASPQTASYFRLVLLDLLNSAQYAIPSSDFIIQGSNDGVTWTDIVTTVGLSWNGFSLPRVPFAAPTPQSFGYYRLYISAVTHLAPLATTTVIAFDLLGTVPNQACSTASAASLLSQADADTKATALATQQAQAQLNCVPAFTATESYTAVCPSGTLGQSVTKTVTYISFVSLADAQNNALAQATAAANAELSCSGSNNSQKILINDNATATPYPAVKFVSGKTGHVTKVTVSITGFTHTNPEDVQILLVAPNGVHAVMAANCGGSHSISNVNLVLDDSAGSALPDSTAIVSGTFKPAKYGIFPNFPLPAPQESYTTIPSTLATFIGVDPNGSWALYVYDNKGLDVGQIAGGFDLVITSA